MKILSLPIWSGLLRLPLGPRASATWRAPIRVLAAATIALKKGDARLFSLHVLCNGNGNPWAEGGDVVVPMGQVQAALGRAGGAFSPLSAASLSRKAAQKELESNQEAGKDLV